MNRYAVTGPSAGRLEFSASRYVASLPIVGRIFPKKRQFWQVLASDQLIETIFLNEMKVKFIHLSSSKAYVTWIKLLNRQMYLSDTVRGVPLALKWKKFCHLEPFGLKLKSSKLVVWTLVRWMFRHRFRYIFQCQTFYKRSHIMNLWHEWNQFRWRKRCCPRFSWDFWAYCLPA